MGVAMLKVRRERLVLLFLGVLTLVLLFLEPAKVPPTWFDEGWCLTIARNWVELGQYAQLKDGDLIPASMLTTGLPAVAPVALSFKLLGVGIWQGRVSGTIYTLGSMGLIYLLARRLYERKVAVATVAVLLLMSAHPELHPVLIGRQALGEIPALFYLLGGYFSLLSAWRRPYRFMVLAIICWGLALRTKPQVLPFWLVSLLFPSLVMLYQRRWQAVKLLTVGAVGSLAVSWLFEILQRQFVYRDLVPAPVAGLYSVTAFVPVLPVRIVALTVTMAFGMLSLLGLGYTGIGFIRDNAALKSWRDIASNINTGVDVVRLSLWTLASSWLVWYVLLSVGWVRYLFPATFLSSIFVAAWLNDITDGFNLATVRAQVGKAIRQKGADRQGTGLLLAGLLVILMVSLTTLGLYRAYVIDADASVMTAAKYLNTSSTPDALVETYDAELFFLLDRPYHYPPDPIHVQLNRRVFLGQNIQIDYDPLAADPDYLVVGPHSKLWHLYDSVLASGQFQLVQESARYKIYKRLRRGE